MRRVTVADWRKGEDPMRVASGDFGHEKVHYEAPASADVPKEMACLIAWCDNPELSPFITAAVTHLWFVACSKRDAPQ